MKMIFNGIFYDQNQYHSKKIQQYVFIKFLKKEYLNDFMNGSLYMNSFDFFREREESIAVGDPFEGVNASYNGNEILCDLNGSRIGGINRLIHYAAGEKNINIFSMTAIPSDKLILAEKTFEFNDEFKRFGDVAVIIPPNNFPEFSRRIKMAFNKKRHIAQIPDEPSYARIVEYIGLEYSGRMGPFRKSQKYSWQYEWRIGLIRKAKNQKPKPYVFNIGSIEDLCLTVDIYDPVKNGLHLI